MAYIAGAYAGFAAALVLMSVVDVGAVVPLPALVGVCVLLSGLTAWWSL